MRFAVLARRLLARRPRLGADDGFTIVELMLACSLGLVILGSATIITAGAGRHNNEVANRADATQRGRLALERMQQMLRSQVCTTAYSTPVTVARADSVTITSDLSGGTRPPQLHTFTFDPTARTLTDAYLQGANTTPVTFTGTTRTASLATDVERTGTQAVFRYYRYPTTAPSSGILEPNVEMVPTATGLSEANRVAIARIDINFATTGATTTTRDIRAQMTDQVFVRLANPNDTTSSFNPSCT